MPTRARAKILVVDDSEDAKSLIRHYLSPLDYELIFASDGREGLTLLEAECIDLVITDIQMPVMSGLKLLEESRLSGCETPFIVLSQTEQKGDVVRALRLGAIDFLEKPYSREALRDGIEKALADFVQEARSATLAQLGAGIAHEISNPLTVNEYWIAQIRKIMSSGPIGSDDQTQVVSLLSKLESTSERINQIVGAVKTLSIGSRCEVPELASLAALVREAAELCGFKIKAAGVEVQFAEEAEPLLVYCRPSEVLQVFINLMSNACDAMAGSSARLVRVETSRIGSDRVAVGFVDSGPGIPENIRKKLFKPFSTGKARGTGLGLNISKRLVEKNGGMISVGLSGGATCIRVELPGGPSGFVGSELLKE